MNNKAELVLFAFFFIFGFLTGAFIAIQDNKEEIKNKKTECVEVRLYLNKSESMVVCGSVVDKPVKEWHARDRNAKT